jgi:hypothetical protein
MGTARGPGDRPLGSESKVSQGDMRTFQAAEYLE